jgi:protein pelota
MHHTFNIDADKMDKISIFKQEWKSHHLQRIDEAVRLRKQAALTFVSLDEDIATIALLRQSGVQRIADIDSKRSGKMYKSKETMKDFFNEILSVIKINKEKDSPLVVVGPGFTKENFIQYGKTKEPLLFTQCLYYGSGAAGMNGIQEAIKKGVIERITKENRVIFETNLIDKLFEEIKKDGLATYGEQEVNSALTHGAVNRLLISDILVRSQKGEEFLRLARENKSQFTIINTLHDSGKKFEGLGGIGAFLRYKIK